MTSSFPRVGYYLDGSRNGNGCARHDNVTPHETTMQHHKFLEQFNCHPDCPSRSEDRFKFSDEIEGEEIILLEPNNFEARLARLKRNGVITQDEQPTQSYPGELDSKRIDQLESENKSLRFEDQMNRKAMETQEVQNDHYRKLIDNYMKVNKNMEEELKEKEKELKSAYNTMGTYLKRIRELEEQLGVANKRPKTLDLTSE